MAVPNPCTKDCPKRSPTCHGECEEYLAFFEERQRINQERHRMNAVNSNVIVDRAIKCALEAKRRR